ncbi:hypothetical protein JB92DRAFT_3134408 [Gautieria morchelliformis]|nr:hypothetical protein JB92DRAFT_3134408 [Gautieria morchelliformis]
MAPLPSPDKGAMLPQAPAPGAMPLATGLALASWVTEPHVAPTEDAQASSRMVMVMSLLTLPAPLESAHAYIPDGWLEQRFQDLLARTKDTPIDQHMPEINTAFWCLREKGPLSPLRSKVVEPATDSVHYLLIIVMAISPRTECHVVAMLVPIEVQAHKIPRFLKVKPHAPNTTDASMSIVNFCRTYDTVLLGIGHEAEGTGYEALIPWKKRLTTSVCHSTISSRIPSSNPPESSPKELDGIVILGDHITEVVDIEGRLSGGSIAM